MGNAIGSAIDHAIASAIGNAIGNFIGNVIGMERSVYEQVTESKFVPRNEVVFTSQQVNAFLNRVSERYPSEA